MILTLGENLVGSLDQYTNRLVTGVKVSIEDCRREIRRTAGKVINKTVGVGHVHPPIIDAGTHGSRGLLQLFHKLSRARPSMT